MRPAGDSTVTGGAVMGRVLRRCGVSPCELATRMGVPEAHVEAWMHGDPPPSVVHAVAQACSTDLAAVLVEPDSDPPIHCLHCGRSSNVSIGWASSRAVRH